MNLSIGTNHNLSCSTYFIDTKSTKKSNKCKTSHSERNLSTIVSEVNNNKNDSKENCHLRGRNNEGKVEGKKKMNKKGSFLGRDVEMFVSTKKREGYPGAMIKKKR